MSERSFNIIIRINTRLPSRKAISIVFVQMFFISFQWLQSCLLLSWTVANEAVGTMKLFNNYSGSRGLKRSSPLCQGTSLFLRTPFTEGCAGANEKALAVNDVALVVLLRSVQFSSVQPFRSSSWSSSSHHHPLCLILFAPN